MIDHLAIQTADVAVSAAFYDTVLATIGAARIIDRGDVIGYGIGLPKFWLGPLTTGPARREIHVAFTCSSRDVVNDFYRAAIELGAESLHQPQVWPEYHPGYYGAFVRDPDGNNVEAVHHTFG